MRILLLTMYFKPDAAATGLLMSELAEELAAMGHDITVVTSMPHYTTNAIWKEYRGKLWTKEKQRRITIHRVFTYVPHNKEKLLGRFISYLTFHTLSTLAALFTGKHDVILIPSPSPPLVNGLSAYVLSKLRGIPFVSNVQDIYPDVGIRLGLLTNAKAIAGYRAMERFVYNKSAAVTVISDGFKRNLQEKGVPDAKLTVIPNFIDANFVTPHPRLNAFSAEHNLHEKFVVLFAGNVGLSQGLENVLEAAELLKEIKDIQFLIVGNGAAKPFLVEKTQQMGLKNVKFLPYQEYERIPEFYSASDVCLVPLRKGLTEESVPSKVFTIMGVARPLIASVDGNSDTFCVVNQSDCGICVEPENPQAMAEAIMNLYNNKDEAIRKGAKGRSYVESRFTRTRVAQQYEELFNHLIGQEVVEAKAEEPMPASAVIKSFKRST